MNITFVRVILLPMFATGAALVFVPAKTYRKSLTNKRAVNLFSEIHRFFDRVISLKTDAVGGDFPGRQLYR